MLKEATREEVIEILISLTKNTIGEKAVNQILTKSFNGDKKEADVNGLIFKFADEIQNIYGENGGFAIIRQLGREVAKVLMENHPKEEWEELLKEGLKVLGFAEGIEKSYNIACICNCIFFEKELMPRNVEPIKHCICWFGLGFIEGFVREIKNVKGVKWVSRDYENKRCMFTFLN